MNTKQCLMHRNPVGKKPKKLLSDSFVNRAGVWRWQNLPVFLPAFAMHADWEDCVVLKWHVVLGGDWKRHEFSVTL